MSILILGSTGQLARHLRQLMPSATFLSRQEADLAQPHTLADALINLNPEMVVNAAAYTAVDRAESEPSLAWRVNAESPAALACLCASIDIPLVHFSTDYVFDGKSGRAYGEHDPVAPVNVYGATKLAGELAVRSIAPKHWIIRTSWVFSEFGTNFVKTMLRLARERDELRVVADQHGIPTFAGDLARVVAALSDSAAELPFGTHHASGGPALSWHGFATRIISRAHEKGVLPRIPSIQPIPTSAYPTPARRPQNSVLQPSPALASLVRFDWEAGLDTVLNRLG